MPFKNLRFFSILLVLSVALVTNAIGLTAEQMQMLQQLSPEERQALIKQQGSSSEVVQKPLSTPRVVVPVKTQTVAEVKREKEKAKPIKTTPLEPFGYDLFKGVPTTFAPATDIPIPVDYVIGPGDNIILQFFGKENARYSLVVTREGTVQIPKIGPVSVAGQRFSELEKKWQAYINEKMIGVRASITMGPLRSIRVFVLGEASRPGSYTVSALSTMTNALFVSGGIKYIGSLRNIQLKREGRLVTRLDLYDLLLKGDTSGDVRLLPGDVIFVPPVGRTVGIAGAARRPAIYELKNEKTVGDLVRIAGGLRPTALKEKAQLRRISSSGERIVLDVNLANAGGKRLSLFDGDVLEIKSVLDRLEGAVRLSGHVERPGTYQWREGMRLTDLIASVEYDLKPRPDLDYALIKREIPPDRRIEVIPIRLDLAISYPQTENNTVLKPRDEVIVFSLGEDRAPLLKPILAQLRRQANIDDPERIVTISGNVKFPGQYPLHRGMRVSDLARAGILSPNSDLDYALLERTTSPGNRVSVQSVRLASAASPDTIDNLPLKAFDRFIVFSNAAGRQELIKPTIGKLRLQARVDSPEQVVVISGQVAFPGEYPLEKDMTVSDLLRASGNLKQQAYQLEAELIHYQIIDSKIRETHRLPLDFSAIIKGDEKHDQILRPFDTINIKQVAEWGDRQTVEVRGEVMFPGGYVVERGETLTDLIERVGGFTERAFLDGAVLVREDLRNKEQEQINRLRDQLKGDLAAIELQQFQEDPQKREALSMAQGLLAQLESTKAVGRLVIDLEGIAYGVKTDIVLQDKDRIFIPDTPQEVSVLGEVNYPTSHVFDEKLARDDYINQSGGATYKADKGRIYVVKANGQVMSPKASTWFYKGQQGIQVGDTIVVPLDADRVSPLFLWTSIAQIVYQGALTIAAFNSIGVF